MVTKDKLSECSLCGVAYDMGRNRCVEKDCQPIQAVVEKRPIPRKKLARKSVAYERLTNLKSRAHKKCLSFDLDEQFLANLLDTPCVYCGSELMIEVDRKSPAQGYVYSNVVPACRRCNTIKNNVVTYEEMMKIAHYLGWGWAKDKEVT